MKGVFIYVNISRSYNKKNKINLCKIELETSNNNLVAEYMLNKVSIQVFVSSSRKFMKSVVKHSFLCCPAISYGMSVTLQ